MQALPAISYEAAEQCGRGKGGKAGGSSGGSRPASGDRLGLNNRGRSPNSPLSGAEAEIASRALARRLSAQGQRNTLAARSQTRGVSPDLTFGRIR
ncbi:hypothetical protein [Leptolyngbya ohadii]|uniref:hypothetical protein n=1 Tax=Leptolyngbya ohadii TaxID=1962290 RepID=UPI00117AFDB0|nr:hypothetical protein [Leptolyngbya ohadii]